MASRWGGAYDFDGPGVHGVEVDVVCRNVPVVCLNKASDFEENAAWMIQATSDGTGRADSLYEYCNDSDVMSACRKLGLGKDEICIVRLREHKELRAVGTSGKRSTMLACVIALSLADPDGLEDLWAGLRS
ncbi:unnamed protein product [Prorocentrum cordatum]|uniref:Ubiquitinyl hydrolase 1 n=1 Tax=Prorocentrum cordatum TaxID=2364126 RepID=A0ABN9RCH0_9DINO|nr:unnamed protein product [Polarella glacialis]